MGLGFPSVAPNVKKTPIPRLGSPAGCQRYWSKL